jgi:hypothetical protein
MQLLERIRGEGRGHRGQLGEEGAPAQGGSAQTAVCGRRRSAGGEWRRGEGSSDVRGRVQGMWRWRNKGCGRGEPPRWKRKQAPTPRELLHRFDAPLDVTRSCWRRMRARAATPPTLRELSTAMAFSPPISSFPFDSLEEVQRIGVPTARRRRSRGGAARPAALRQSPCSLPAEEAVQAQGTEERGERRKCICFCNCCWRPQAKESKTYCTRKAIVDLPSKNASRCWGQPHGVKSPIGVAMFSSISHHVRGNKTSCRSRPILGCVWHNYDYGCV